MGGDSGGDQTVYQKSEPWAGAQPLAGYVMQSAGKLPDYWNQIGAAGPYQGQRVALFSPDQLMAQQGIRNMATDQNTWMPGFNSAMAQVTSDAPQQIYNQGIGSAWNSVINPTLSGQYMYAQSNPYLQSNIDYATRPIFQNLNQNTLPGLASTANQAGRYGSGAWQQLSNNAISGANRQASDTAAQIAGANYEAERGRQMQAANYPMQLYDLMSKYQMQASPVAQSWLNQAYKNLGYLTSSGEAQQALYQNILGANRQAYDEMVNNPYNLLANLGNLAFTGGQMGGVKTTTQPNYGPSLGSQLIGAGATGLGLYNDVKGIDWGSLLGN